MSGSHPSPVCITCGDVAVPMRVLRTDGEDGLATCTTDSGASEEVDIGLVDGVVPGDAVLVHASVALQRLEGDAA